MFGSWGQPSSYRFWGCSQPGKRGTQLSAPTGRTADQIHTLFITWQRLEAQATGIPLLVAVFACAYQAEAPQETWGTAGILQRDSLNETGHKSVGNSAQGNTCLLNPWGAAQNKNHVKDFHSGFDKWPAGTIYLKSDLWLKSNLCSFKFVIEIFFI